MKEWETTLFCVFKVIKMNEEMNENSRDFLDDIYETENTAETDRTVTGNPADDVVAVKVVKSKTELIKKLLIAAICLVVVGASIGFGYYIAKHPADNGGSEQTTVSDTTEVFGGSYEENEDDEDDDTTANNEADTGTTLAPSADIDLATAILGQWTDNANLSGYEFLEDGIMKVTYFNMSALNLEDIVDGTYRGTYTLEGDKLTISYTIYSKAVVKKYTVKVEDNNLYMTSSEGDKSVYVRKGSEPAVNTEIDKKLLGKWSSNLSGYEFKDNGVVTITYINLSSMGINLDINGKVDGIYELDGDKLNIKFSIYSSVIEKKYTYKVDGKTLTLTDRESGEKGTYVKEAE